MSLNNSACHERKNSLFSYIAVIIMCAVFIMAFAGCSSPDDTNGNGGGLNVINKAIIQGVTAPVTGRTPVRNIPDTDQYTGTVEWAPEVKSTFASGIEYQAYIALTPKSGYTLQGARENLFTVEGAESARNDAGSGFITASFPATVEAVQSSITITGLNFGSSEIDVFLFSTAGFNTELLSLGKGRPSFDDTLIVNLYDDLEFSSPWYGNGQYYVELKIGYHNLFYCSTEPVMFSDTAPGAEIDFSKFKRYFPDLVDPIPFQTNAWVDGYIPPASGGAADGGTTGVQWFEFTATGNEQYIHAIFNYPTVLSVEIYDSDNNMVGSQKSFSYRTNYDTCALSAGQYYVKVGSYDSSGSGGIYQIAFNESQSADTIKTELPQDATTLTENVWGNGTFPASGATGSGTGVQWFKFTATGNKQFIHFDIGTVNNLYAQVYDADGYMAGSNTQLYNFNGSLYRNLNAGQEYYIKVWPSYSSNSGTYRIGFNTVFELTPNVTTLTENSWSDGNIPASGAAMSKRQWFRFTATAAEQYIHISFGTMINVNVQVIKFTVNDDGGFMAQIGNQTCSGSTTYCGLAPFNIGQEYYILVSPPNNSSDSGTYRIAFKTSATPPPEKLPSNAVRLNINTWANGNTASGGSKGEQWFRFTATAATQYINIGSGTLTTSLYVQMYDADGYMVGSKTELYTGNRYAFLTLTTGQDYYIKVWPSNPSNSGTYRIAFDASTTTPFFVTQLTANTMVDGNIKKGSEQWYKFTATASTQYIHAMFSLSAQVYDIDGNTVGTSIFFNYYATRYVSRTLTIGQEYYIKAWTSYEEVDSYRIGFNGSWISPLLSDIPQLQASTWTDGNISVSGGGTGEQWFKFMATAATHYIHASFGTLVSLYVQVYDSTGNTVGSETNLYGNTTYISRTLTSGQMYYIKVSPYDSSTAGRTYRILFNNSPTLPVTLPSNAVTLTANTWVDGNIPSGSATGEQWFKFNAGASSQYLHIRLCTLSRLYFQMYDSAGNTVGNQAYLSNESDGSTKSTQQQDLAAGQDYYIKVWPAGSLYSGTYKIAFNTSAAAPAYTPKIPPSTVTTLADATWVSGNVPDSNSEQWFKFTATAATQYIHISFGTANSLYVQLYDSFDLTVGSQTYLSYYSSIKYLYQTLTVGEVYYIKILPFNYITTGTYKIAFNAVVTPPPVSLPANQTQLTADTWSGGNIPASDGEQWFSFTATANTQYIHAGFETLNDLYVQVYNSSGNTVGSQTRLYSGTRYTSLSLNNGQQYYIRVWPYSGSGAYKIAFNTTEMPPMPPSANITTLTASIWTDGNISSSPGEQWFKFTATASTQYIHGSFGTLNDLFVQVYSSSGNMVGSQTRLYSGTIRASRNLSVGEDYYIRVLPYNSTATGTYKILFKESWMSPSVSAVNPLVAAGVWANGNIPSGGATDGQWFKFTATASTQYIHFKLGLLFNNVVVQVFDSIGNSVGDPTNLSLYSTSYTSRTLTAGQVYYINVRPFGSTTDGKYQIAFNGSTATPTAVITTITDNTLWSWADGNIPAMSTDTGEQWFKFTATAATQYIHAKFGTLDDMYAQVYDSAGNTVGSRLNFYSQRLFDSWTLTVGQEYYIKVWPYKSSGSGTYQIALSASQMAPTALTTLVVNTWADGNITTTSGAQWFKFTATADTQYIHADFDTLTSLYVQVYDSSGNTVGTQTNLKSGTKYTSRTLNARQQYYIKVWPYSGKGTYFMAFNTSSIVHAPNTIQLTLGNYSTVNIPEPNGERWFKFTATKHYQYIQADFDNGTLTSIYVQVYDLDHKSVDRQSFLTSAGTFTNLTLTVGQEYYMRVKPSTNSSGICWIRFY